jgi:hypothetical protein
LTSSYFGSDERNSNGFKPNLSMLSRTASSFGGADAHREAAGKLPIPDGQNQYVYKYVYSAPAKLERSPRTGNRSHRDDVDAPIKVDPEKEWTRVLKTMQRSSIAAESPTRHDFCVS